MRILRQNPDTVAPPVGTYSQAVRVETAIERWRERLEDRYERPDFPLALARKGLDLVLGEAQRAGVSLTMTETAAARADEGLDAGLGERDFGAVAGFLRG